MPRRANIGYVCMVNMLKNRILKLGPELDLYVLYMAGNNS